MKVDPAILSATLAIPNCPDCGSKHYAVSSRLVEGEAKCEAITCADCNFDILAAYSKLNDETA
jgi:DNA-directed RNA polymerase subunit RPC12/RpoP